MMGLALQEALSCMYYLLQQIPSIFCDFEARDDNGVLEMIVTAILSLLKSAVFSWDCLVAAGVSFCAALQVCLSSDELGLAILEGLFCQTSVTGSKSEVVDTITKVLYKWGFVYSREFHVPSRIRLIRGILTSVSRTVLNTPFIVPKGGSTGFQTILHVGILPELCNYCENPLMVISTFMH